MARDLARPEHRSVLKQVFAALDDGDWVPVLTAHQCIELLRHGSREVAAARLELLHWLAGRARVGWVAATDDARGLGSTLDITALEIEAVLSGALKGPAILPYARERFFRFGPPPVSEWRDLDLIRPVLQRSMLREREVMSLAAIQSLSPGDASIGALRGLETSSNDEAAARLRTMVNRLAAELRQRGDKRLTSPVLTAEDFVEEVAGDIENFDSDSPPIDQIIGYFGLDPTAIPDTMSFDDLAYWAEALAKARIAARLVGLEDRVEPSLALRLPTLILQTHLKRRRLKAGHRASGGDNTDTYIAALALYFDHVIGDKRTVEFFRQASCEVEMPLGRVSKLSGYDELVSLLA